MPQHTLHYRLMLAIVLFISIKNTTWAYLWSWYIKLKLCVILMMGKYHTSLHSKNKENKDENHRWENIRRVFKCVKSFVYFLTVQTKSHYCSLSFQFQDFSNTQWICSHFVLIYQSQKSLLGLNRFNVYRIRKILSCYCW